MVQSAFSCRTSAVQDRLELHRIQERTEHLRRTTDLCLQEADGGSLNQQLQAGLASSSLLEIIRWLYRVTYAELGELTEGWNERD